MSTSLARAFVLAALLVTGSAQAQSLPPPTGEVLLTLAGAITETNGTDADGQPVAQFDRAMLEAMPQAEVKTSTPWTDGVPVFTGVLARDLLERVGVTGSEIKALALNDYTVQLSVAELRQFPVLLAMRMNGKALTVRDKGPIWVILPRDEYPELADAVNEAKWIWQLKRMDIR